MKLLRLLLYVYVSALELCSYAGISFEFNVEAEHGVGRNTGATEQVVRSIRQIAGDIDAPAVADVHVLQSRLHTRNLGAHEEVARS